MTFLQEGDLAGARAVLAAAPKEVEPTALVVEFATGDDLYWVLDDAQRDVLLRLTPGAFDGDRGTWGLVLAQAWALRGDQAKVREYAEEARKAIAAPVAEARDGEPDVYLGLALAYLGRKAEAVREGEGIVALGPIEREPFGGPYVQHQARADPHPAREPRAGAGPAGAVAEGPLLPHARLAAHRPQLRSAPRQPPLREARARAVEARPGPSSRSRGRE